MLVTNLNNGRAHRVKFLVTSEIDDPCLIAWHHLISLGVIPPSFPLLESESASVRSLQSEVAPEVKGKPKEPDKSIQILPVGPRELYDKMLDKYGIIIKDHLDPYYTGINSTGD